MQMTDEEIDAALDRVFGAGRPTTYSTVERRAYLAGMRAGIEQAAKIAGSYGPKVPVLGTEIASAIRVLLNETAGE